MEVCASFKTSAEVGVLAGVFPELEGNCVLDGLLECCGVMGWVDDVEVAVLVLPLVGGCGFPAELE